MEDFLKDRPVVEAPPAKESAPVATDPAEPAPFGELSDATIDRSSASSCSSGAEAAGQTLTAEGGARVETVVEGGRVTRIIITCSCGKVTEVACRY